MDGGMRTYGSLLGTAHPALVGALVFWGGRGYDL